MTAKTTISLICFIGFTAAWMGSCLKKESPVVAPGTLKLVVPSNFPPPEDIFKNNRLTKEGFELGRKLFYDGRLAKDGVTSCASCHQQFAAFATFEHPFSHGINNQFTTRNAPGLFNLAWHRELHWDGGINHLEVQPLAPITAPNEMGETIGDLVSKLNSNSRYREMFRSAFGDPEVTAPRLLKALAQFMGMLVSSGSKYDKVKSGLAKFSQAEESGYAIFLTKCGSCHKEPLFTDLSYRNTGIPPDPILKDIGRMRITRLREDSLKFKVPSLRNVMLTAPYGHDGRFFSASAMIDHYRTGVQAGPTLDPRLRYGLSISNNEKADLLQFLGTLTDTAFVKDSRFKDPG